MPTIKWNKRFFASRRGRIIALLRRKTHTVNELAAELDLTNNAVRAHLSTLEQDGLIQQGGSRRGIRKPHSTYTLAPAATHLFPQPYGPLLDHLLAVLATHLEPETLEEILREVGHRMAAGYMPELEGLAFQQRLETALNVLEDIGGLATLEEVEGKWYIRGYSCPLAAVVAQHPQVCRLAEMLLTDIAGVPVQECCIRTGTPRCCFEVELPPII